MKVLVTGASGFVGTHLINELKATSADLMVVTRDASPSLSEDGRVRVLEGDLRHLSELQDDIRAFKPDACVHLAWQDIPDYSAPVSKMNLLTSIGLIDFLVKEVGCKKLIFSGSCFEYGRRKGACKETDECDTSNYFGWAKISLYNYAALLCREHDVDLAWLRIFYVYGPGQREGALIPTLVRSYMNGETPKINNPFNANDFIYVGDVAEAFRIATEKKLESGVYNLGWGASTALTEIIQIADKAINGTLDKSDVMIKQSTARQDMEFWADMQKTRECIGWVPKTSIEEGIKKYIESYNIK